MYEHNVAQTYWLEEEGQEEATAVVGQAGLGNIAKMPYPSIDNFVPHSTTLTFVLF